MKLFLRLFVVSTLALVIGCASPAPEPPADEALTVYSGRSETLIGPLLERFSEETGREVNVRYGDTSELTATILEEGERTPADLFISQDAVALGALAKAGLLRPLTGEVLDRVPVRFRDEGGLWVGLSGRARTVVYNPERMAVDQLPQSLEEVCDPRFEGRFGLAPANASFQAHMAVYSSLFGEQALVELLACLVENDPRRYPKNSPIVEATISGEIDFGLVNHYYLWRALAENPDAPGRNFFQSEPGSGFINLAGAGVLSDRPAALELVAYLLGDLAQSYFAGETFEYPLVEGVEPSIELEPLAELRMTHVDLATVSDLLPRTLELIHESGLLE